MKNGKNDKTRKMPASDKKRSPQSDMEREEAVAAIMYGLDLFIAQASREELGAVARLLYNAKEEIVLWSVTMGYHETMEEKFINRHLYNNCLFAVSDLLTKLCAARRDERFIEILKSTKPNDSPLTIMEALRKSV